MKLFRYTFIAFLIITLIGCSDKAAEEKPSAPPVTSGASSDVTELEKLINLPIKPLSVMWEMNRVTEPSSKYDREDWSVVARMELTEKDFKILSNVPMPNKLIKFPKYAVEPWMEDIIASKFKLDKTGDFYRPLGTVLSAEQFYRDPLVTGAIYMVSETEILLYLQTE